MALDSYREMMDELASTPVALREAAEAAGDPPEGEWGAAKILAHMASAEHFYFERLNIMLQQQNPHLKSFQEPAAERMASMTGNTWQENLDAFNTIRGDTISLLMGMTLADWDRSATHATLGDLTVEQIIENIADHDAEHISQLRDLA